MKKFLFILVFVLVVATVMVACSPVTAEQYNAQTTQMAELANQQATQQAWLEYLASQTTVIEIVQTETPELTATPAPIILTSPQLRTAEEIRDFGRVIGWVSGGNEGQWVSGAQIELKADFELKTLPNGAVYEFECVHYTVLSGEVYAEPVCEGALLRFDTNSVIAKGTVGTFWLSWAVEGTATEEWEEGFLNLPCECPSGDCRVS